MSRLLPSLPKTFLVLILWLLIFPPLAAGTGADVVIYENGADGDTAPWFIHPAGAAATLANVADDDAAHDRVIALSANSPSTRMVFYAPPNNPWQSPSYQILQWDFKYQQRANFLIMLKTDNTAINNGYLYLSYATDNTPGFRGNTFYYQLDPALADGVWHTLTRNLQQDVSAFSPATTILGIQYFSSYGSGRIDNLEMHKAAALATVSGLVTNRVQNPLEGALVGINGLVSTRTDQEGRYALPGIPPGSVELAIKKPGYSFLPITLTVDPFGTDVSKDLAASGTLSSVVYDDGSDGNTAPWFIHPAGTGSTLQNVADEDTSHGRVISLTANAPGTRMVFYAPVDFPWAFPAYPLLQWDLKYQNSANFLIMLKTDNLALNNGYQYLSYSTHNTPGQRGNTFYFRLDPELADGKWHTITRDLQADVAAWSPTTTITGIQYFSAYGSGRLDNLLLKKPDRPKVEVSVLDPNSHFFSTFQSHNQKLVQNQYGIFLAYFSSSTPDYSQTHWRLLRSVNGGDSFSVIYEGTAGIKPPILETDEAGNVYLIHSVWLPSGTTNDYFLRFSPADNFQNPLIQAIPGSGAAEKYAAAYDPVRRQIYYLVSSYEKMKFFILGLDGAVKQTYQLVQSGPDGENALYPVIQLDASGVLYAAWTTQMPGWTIERPLALWSQAGDFASGTLLTADLNGQGGEDLILVNPGAAGWQATTALNSGDGRFNPPVTFAEDGNVLGWTPAIADFDGDAKLDLLVQGKTAAGHWAARLARGKGDGTFWPSVLWEANVPVTAGQFVASDFNGDNKADLAVINNDASGLQTQVALATGAASFGTAVATALTGDLAGFRYYPGEVNGDRCADLIFQQNDAQGWRASIFIGNCDGTFRAPAVWESAGDFSGYAPAIAEFNGDGLTDLALWRNSAAGAQTVVALRGPKPCTGEFADSFRPPLFYSRPGNFTGWVSRLADFNGDHRDDLVLYSVGQSGWRVQLAASVMGPQDCEPCESPYFSGVTFTNPGIAYDTTRNFSGFGFITGDFNGDHKADFLLERRATSSWETQFGRSNLPFTYRSINAVASDDGGASWRTLSGAPLPAPITAGVNSAAGRINLDDELEPSTWLQSLLARDNKVHYSYLAKMNMCPYRQHYVRYGLPTGNKEIDVYPWTAANNPDFPIIKSLDGFFIAQRDPAIKTIYSVQQADQRIVVLESNDQGETWQERGASDRLDFVIYAIGGYRYVTDDGYLIGTFTRGNPAPQQTYFFRLKVR